MGKVQRPPSAGAPELQAKHLCTRVTLLADLQILDCELYKNAFGGPLGKL